MQSDQSLRCPQEEILHTWLSKMRAVKILIRLRESAGWSESSLGAHVQRYVFWRRVLYGFDWRWIRKKYFSCYHENYRESRFKFISHAHGKEGHKRFIVSQKNKHWIDSLEVITEYHYITSSEKVSSNMRKRRRFRSSCACAKYHMGLCSPFIHSVISSDYGSRE